MGILHMLPLLSVLISVYRKVFVHAILSRGKAREHSRNVSTPNQLFLPTAGIRTAPRIEAIKLPTALPTEPECLFS